MTTSRWETLPCGHDPRQLLDLVADRRPLAPDAHEATCTYCQAALAELGRLWHPIRQWASQPVELPKGFLSMVINRVRRLAQSPRHIAASTARGATTVTSWVLGLIATAAAQATPGVDRITPPALSSFKPSRRGDVIRYGADGVDIEEVGGDAVAVTLGVTAKPGEDLHAIGDRIRQNVIDAITATTAIPVARVDVTIDDITDGESPPQK